MGSTPSLLLLPGSLWLEVVAPDRVLSMGQIWHLNYVQTNDFFKIEFSEIEIIKCV